MRIKDLTAAQFRKYFEIRLQGHKLQKSSGGVVTTCPFHEEKNPSFSVNFEKGVFKCHAENIGGGILDFEKKFSNCDDQTAIGNIAELIGEQQLVMASGAQKPEVIYDYLNEFGKLLFQVVRYPKDPQTGKKKINQRRPCQTCDNGKSQQKCTNPDCRHGWVWKKDGLRKVLYHLPSVITANEVLVTEGEKDADRLKRAMVEAGVWRAELAVTTSPEGAGKWRDEYAPYFAGKKVIIFPDNDPPGEQHAEQVARSVSRYAVWVKVVKIPHLGDKEDVTDYFDKYNGTVEELMGYVKGTSVWKAVERGGTKMFVDIVDFVRRAPLQKNWVVEGLVERGSNGFVIAKPKGGKAQPVDANVLTPNGWAPIGSIRPGDEVIGVSGTAVRVSEIHPQGVVPCYRVTMSDGSSTEATADHLWAIESHNDRVKKRGVKLVTTEEIRERLSRGEQRFSYIPLCAPVSYPRKELPIAPYVLGALLGDGGMTTSTITLTTHDAELVDRFEKELPLGTRLTRYKEVGTYGVRTDSRKRSDIKAAPMLTRLAGLGLVKVKSADKFIPQQYLRASIPQRLDLLRGLLDTDGCFEGSRKITYCTVSYRLALGMRELVESLGGTATIRKKKRHYKLRGQRINTQDAYFMAIKLPRELGCPFSIKRKAEKWERSRHGLKKIPCRSIVSVEFSREAEAVCITVDSRSGLYVTENHIVTHNSFSTIDLAIALASGTPWLNFNVQQKLRVAHVSREDNPDTSTWRYKELLKGRSIFEEELRGQVLINTKYETPRFMLDEEEWILQLIEDMKATGTQFLILDVLNKMHGADENDNTEMRAIMDRVDFIQRETGAQWCIVHHYNKGNSDDDVALTEMMRGASAIAGAAEWIAGFVLVDEEKHIRKARFDIKSAMPPKSLYWKIDSSGEATGQGIVLKEVEYEPTTGRRKKKAEEVLA